jgi:hypothetical protein
MTERFRRPEHERTEPHRASTGLLRETAGTNGKTGGADAVSRSIGQGYRIVEEYLQQSRRVASEIAPGLSGNADQGIGGLTSRMLRTTSEMFELWFQLLDASGPARQAPMAPVGDGNASTAGPSAPAPAGICVQLESRRPARVTVDVRAGARGRALVAHALRSSDDSLPRIGDVSVEDSRDGEPMSVRVRIPDDQPPGIYHGMVIDDASSLPVGTISVILEEVATVL